MLAPLNIDKEAVSRHPQWNTTPPPHDIECIFTDGNEMVLASIHLISSKHLMISPSGVCGYEYEVGFDPKDIIAWMPAPDKFTQSPDSTPCQHP